MAKVLLILSFICFSFCTYAQVDTAQAQKELPITPSTEEQLENITENNADVETEDDSYLQELAQYTRHPLNLNTADEVQLQELKLISPIQIRNLFRYRQLLGNLVNIYELQAVPGWNI